MGASKYASKTDVSVQESQAELSELLRRYDADEVLTAYDRARALVGFSMAGRCIKLAFPLPKLDEFAHDSAGRKRNRDRQRAAYEQALMARWRCLVLVVKAKLEAVAIGMSTLEQEFLSDMALPDGRRVGDILQPQLEQALNSGVMPRLLPPASA